MFNSFFLRSTLYLIYLCEELKIFLDFISSSFDVKRAQYSIRNEVVD